MIKNKLKNAKGISLISLSIAVIVILVITSIIIYNVKDNLKIERLKNMQNDISNLSDKIETYYAQYGAIPAKEEYTNSESLANIDVISDVVDIGKFYMIDLEALDNLTLNYGEDYKEWKNGVDVNILSDLYIINETSHNIFYVQGIKIEDEIFYTNYTKDDIDKTGVALKYDEGDEFLLKERWTPTYDVDGLYKDKNNNTLKIPAGFQVCMTQGKNTVDDGLVVRQYEKDESGNVTKDNRYVWIEVPKTVTENATNDSEIETALQGYATDYRNGSATQNCNWTDEWYDYYGTTYDGASEYSKVKYITSSTRFTNAKTYYGTIYTDNTGTTEATSYASGTTYYAKITDKINDTSECGLTYSKYNELKSKMLNSIKNNGGFWIGQYEMGTDTARIRKTDPLTTPVCKEGAYPYNYVTCSQAQERASTLSTGNYTSSLMFGIQWDLVCKFIETNATNPGSTVDTIQKAIKNNSKDWGNYKDASFEITRGQYTTSPSTANSWKNFDIRTDGYVENNTKLASTSVLLTTGATERNSLLNIYDFAGNVREWTLEKSSSSVNLCGYRGGNYGDYGSGRPASFRDSDAASGSDHVIGFRPTLY